MASILAKRFHDISCGHRVVGHEGKCRHLHGHNYRIHFTCQADNETSPVDDIGRVMDFGEIKSRLCMWLEDNWDHKFLAWDRDPLFEALEIDSGAPDSKERRVYFDFVESIVFVPFNPTAENIAEYILKTVGPEQLHNTGIILTSVIVEETTKCSAICEW